MPFTLDFLLLYCGVLLAHMTAAGSLNIAIVATMFTARKSNSVQQLSISTALRLPEY